MASLWAFPGCGVVGMRIYQTRQPFSSHRQSSADASYLTVNAWGKFTVDRRATLVCCYTPYKHDCPGLCASELIAVSHNCAVMWSVIPRTFDNLLWPEAPDVPHIHLPRTASLNSKGFEEVHIVQLCECQSSLHPQTSLEKCVRKTSVDAELLLHGLVYVKGSETRVGTVSVLLTVSIFYLQTMRQKVWSCHSPRLCCFVFSLLPSLSVFCSSSSLCTLSWLSESCVIAKDRRLVFLKSSCDAGWRHTTRTNQSGRMLWSETEEKQNSVHSPTSSVMWLLSLWLISYHLPCFYL